MSCLSFPCLEWMDCVCEVFIGEWVWVYMSYWWKQIFAWWTVALFIASHFMSVFSLPWTNGVCLWSLYWWMSVWVFMSYQRKSRVKMYIYVLKCGIYHCKSYVLFYCFMYGADVLIFIWQYITSQGILLKVYILHELL